MPKKVQPPPPLHHRRKIISFPFSLIVKFSQAGIPQPCSKGRIQDLDTTWLAKLLGNHVECDIFHLHISGVPQQ